MKYDFPVGIHRYNSCVGALSARAFLKCTVSIPVITGSFPIFKRSNLIIMLENYRLLHLVDM